MIGTTRHDWLAPGTLGPQLATWGDFGYDYDHIGNRRTSDVDAVPTTYTINNPLNQYTTVSNPSASLTYDADGNLLSDGSFNYTWDGANRLRSIEPLGPWQFGDKRLTFWYDYLGRVAFTQHDEYTNEYGFNHWGETGWDWFIYDGWNVVQEIDACWWTPKAQYSWGLDLSQTLQGAGGIGGLLAMHVPADRCAAIGGGASAMSFRMPGSLAGLATAADGTADGLAIDGSVDSSGGGAGEPVGILERLIARRDALLAAGLLGGTGGVSESPQTQIDGGEVQTLTTGGDCDFWYLYDANGNVGQLLRYDAGTSAVSLAAAYEYDPYGNTLVVRDVDNSGIAAANKYRFSTKRLIDELAASGQGGAIGATGLYYYGHRFYSSGLGRWVSRDPIEEEGGVNLVSFVENGPVIRTDPLGQWGLGDHASILKEALTPALVSVEDQAYTLCYQKLLSVLTQANQRQDGLATVLDNRRHYNRGKDENREAADQKYGSYLAEEANKFQGLLSSARELAGALRDGKWESLKGTSLIIGSTGFPLCSPFSRTGLFIRAHPRYPWFNSPSGLVDHGWHG